MTIVYKDDLGNQNIPKYFEQLAISTREVASKVMEFHSSSQSELQGLGYDSIRARMEYFNDALTKAASLCEIFGNNVAAANAQLSGYMESLDVIDDSLIDETQHSLDLAYADLERLESYYLYKERDSDGHVTYAEWRRVGTDAEIAACKELIAYCEFLLDKMKGLKAADDGAYSLLDSVSFDIDAFGKAVSGMKSPGYQVDPMDLVDTSNMTDTAKEILDKIMDSWPDDMTEEEILLVQTALEYLGIGVHYDRGMRCNTDSSGRYNLDCSSFIMEVLTKTGLIDKETGSLFTDPKRTESARFNDPQYGGQVFDPVSNNDLRPGDICLLSDSKYDGVHVFMYIGQDSSGQKMYIDCSESYRRGNGERSKGQVPGMSYNPQFGDVGIETYPDSLVKACYRLK